MVAVASYYVIVTTNACTCATITSDHVQACIVATHVLAVTTLDICGMFV